MRWARVAELLLAVLVLFCAAAWGGVVDWAVAPAAGLAGAALLAASQAAAESGRTFRIPALAWVPLALAALALVQCIPLPLGILAHASPFLHGLGTWALRPLGLEHARAISLDPSRSLLEASKHLTCFAALTAAHALSRDHGVRRRVLLVVAGTATLFAVVGVVHLLAGWEALFGALRFRESSPPLLTPFGNPNHLAGFLTLGASILPGLLVQPEERSHRVVWGAAYVAIGAALFLSLSRGGLLAFFVAQGLFALLFVRSRRRSGTPLGWPPAVGLLLLCTVVAVGGYLVSEPLWAEFFPAAPGGAGASKAAQWPAMARAASAFPLGMGRGAFIFGFGGFQDGPGTVQVTHPENAVLQMATELGWVAGLAVVGSAVWLWLRALRGRSGAPLELAALCAVAGLAVQNLFDFSLESLGCAVAASVTLGAASPAGTAVRKRLGPAPMRAVLGITAAVAVALGFAGPQATADEAALARLTQQAPGASAAVLRAALPRIDRHPADPWLYVAVGHAITEDPSASPADALTWVNRALFLRPMDPQPHLVAARALLRMGRTVQAMEEYRTYRVRGGRESVLFDEGLPQARSPRALQALLPENDALGMLRFLATHARGDEALAVLDAGRDTLAPLPGGWERALLHASLLRERGRLSEGWAVLAEAEREAPEAAPEAAIVQVEKARFLVAEGKPVDARALLAGYLAARPGAVAVVRELALLQMSAGSPAAARQTVRAALGRQPVPEERVTLLQVEADAYRQEGLPRRAVESLRQAVHAQPHLTGLRFQLAAQLESVGRLTEAAAEIREAVRRETVPPKEAGPWLLALEKRARDEAARREAAALEVVTQGPADAGVP